MVKNMENTTDVNLIVVGLCGHHSQPQQTPKPVTAWCPETVQGPERDGSLHTSSDPKKGGRAGQPYLWDVSITEHLFCTSSLMIFQRWRLAFGSIPELGSSCWERQDWMEICTQKVNKPGLRQQFSIERISPSYF